MISIFLSLECNDNCAAYERNRYLHLHYVLQLTIIFFIVSTKFYFILSYFRTIFNLDLIKNCKMQGILGRMKTHKIIF